MNRNLTIIIGAVIIASMSIGLLFALTSLQGKSYPTDWDKTREKITEYCESIYLDNGFDSVEDCVRDILARIEPSIPQKSEVQTRFDILREICEEGYLDYDYSSAQDCFDKRLPLFDIVLRETP